MENHPEYTFSYECIPQEEVREHIRQCEGKHVQQASYSTFMDTLTQVCYTCGKIRGSHLWEGNRSWKAEV